MREEKECNPTHRFLFSDMILSDTAIYELRNNVINKIGKRDKDNLYERFLRWKRKENEIVIFTLYAYADFKIPKKFDCLFNLNNPDEYVNCDFKLTQSIYESFYPIGGIENGHKHICIFEFDKGIPEMIKKLHTLKNLKYDVPKDSFQIGICSSKDYKVIKQYRENNLLLKQKYGNEWWKYDESE